MSKSKVLVGAAVAMALTAPSFAFTDPATATVRFFVSGASAPTHMLREQVVQNICAPTSDVDIFVDAVNSLPDTDANGDGIPVLQHTANWAVQCVTGAINAAGLAAGERVMIVKTDTGGSGNGVNPVALETQLPFLNTASTNCQSATPAVHEAGDNATNYNLRICGTSGTFANQVPDFGVSDVEPTVFRGPLNNAGLDFGTPPANWQTEGGPGLVFGIAVNLIFRDELQNDQITAGKLAATCDDSAANRETAGCQPDLPSWYIRSLFVGKIGNWADEQVLGGTPNVPGGANARVHVCRRIQGSGTHAQHMIHFNRTNCQTGTSPMLGQPSGGLGLPFVYETSSAGNLGQCLTALNNGTTTTATDPDITVAKTSFAIGYQSLENNPGNNLPYRFVKIDGVAPTVENAWNGDYGQVYFLSYQHRENDFVSGGANLRTALLGGEQAKLELIADSGFDISGTVAGQINQGFTYTFGGSGFLVTVPDASAPAAFTAANPAVPFARVSLTGQPDSCSPLYR